MSLLGIYFILFFKLVYDCFKMFCQFLLENEVNKQCMLCAQSVQLFVTVCPVTHQAPLSMEFSRQEYWSGLPFPTPRYLPNPEI